MQKTLISVVLSFCFASVESRSETTQPNRSGGTSKVSSATKPAIGRGATAVTSMQTGACSPVMSEWLADDYSEKASAGGGKSTVETCALALNPVRGKLANARGFMMTKFSQKIADPVAVENLRACSRSADQRVDTLAGRAFVATNRLEVKTNAALLEIAQADRILRSQSGATSLPNSALPLSGMECRLSFQSSNALCTELKGLKCESQRGRSPDRAKTSEFDQTAARLVEGLDQLAAIEKTLKNCNSSETVRKRQGLHEITKESCDRVRVAHDILRSELKITQGTVFQSIAGISSPAERSRLGRRYVDNPKKITEALVAQLEANRKAAVEHLRQAQSDFNCIALGQTESSNSRRSGGSECDFKAIRNRLIDGHHGDMPMSAAPTELATTIDAVQTHSQCLLEGRMNTDAQRALVKDTAMAMGLVAIGGFGFASMRLAARSLYSSAGTAGKARSAALVSAAGLNLGAAATMSSTDVVKECSAESKAVSEMLESAAKAPAEATCGDRASAFTQASMNETNCLLSVLLAAPDLMPVLGATASLSGLIKTGKRKREVAEFIERSSGRGRSARDLGTASTLTMDERYEAAAKLLGVKELTEAQKKALKEAHEFGGGYDFRPDTGMRDRQAAIAAGVDPVNLPKSKDTILQDGGFTARESALLRGKGLAGSFDEYADPKKYELSQTKSTSEKSPEQRDRDYQEYRDGEANWLRQSEPELLNAIKGWETTDPKLGQIYQKLREEKAPERIRELKREESERIGQLTNEWFGQRRKSVPLNGKGTLESPGDIFKPADPATLTARVNQKLEEFEATTTRSARWQGSSRVAFYNYQEALNHRISYIEKGLELQRSSEKAQELANLAAGDIQARAAAFEKYVSLSHSGRSTNAKEAEIKFSDQEILYAARSDRALSAALESSDKIPVLSKSLVETKAQSLKNQLAKLTLDRWPSREVVLPKGDAASSNPVVLQMNQRGKDVAEIAILRRVLGIIQEDARMSLVVKDPKKFKEAVPESTQRLIEARIQELRERVRTQTLGVPAELRTRAPARAN